MIRKSQTLYAIGKVSKAFGIKGEVVVKPMTENPARFKKLKQVHVGRRSDETSVCMIEHVQVEPRGVRLKILGTSDRTGAEKFVGSLIFVDEEQRVAPKKGSHFIHDVIGLSVVDEDGKTLGTIKDVLQYPAQDVYVIVHDGQEWMVPAVREFVRSIDMASRTMKVRLIEGMIE